MIYERIAKFVEENGIKQSALAEKTGMTKQALSNSLRGLRKITAEEYAAICRALKKSPSFFSDDEKRGGEK